MTGVAWWFSLRGKRGCRVFFVHISGAPPRMGGSGWVAVAIRCLRFWLSPVAVEDSQRDYPNRSHRKIYELFHEVTVSEVTMSLATFRELLVYPHPHPSRKKRTDMVSFLFFFFNHVCCVFMCGGRCTTFMCVPNPRIRRRIP